MDRVRFEEVTGVDGQRRLVPTPEYAAAWVARKVARDRLMALHLGSAHPRGAPRESLDRRPARGRGANGVRQRYPTE